MNTVAEFLREKGLKKTPLRVAILEVFQQKKIPITIAQLKEAVEAYNLSPNQTSLYRQIDYLTQKNILSSIILKNSTAHYELQKDHHHHFICDTCEDITCIDDPLLETHIHSLEEKMTGSGIHISSHQFSLHGTCSQCTH